MTGQPDGSHWCGACTAHVLLTLGALLIAANESLPWTVTVASLAIAGGIAFLLYEHQEDHTDSTLTDWTDQ